MDHLNAKQVGNPQAAIGCPRCGYDMGGLTATWKEVCDLRGTCSECGYEFAWSDVMRPERQLPRWLFDYSSGAAGSWASAWKTFWNALLPPRFFRRVQLWHEPVAQRFVWWLPLLLAGAYATFVVMGLISTWVTLSGMAISRVVRLGLANVYEIGTYDWIHYANVCVAPVGEFMPLWTPSPTGYIVTGWRWDTHSLSPGIVFAGVAALAWPVALLLMRPSRRIARIRGVHVLRCTVYSLDWVVALAWLFVGWRTLRTILLVLDWAGVNLPFDRWYMGFRDLETVRYLWSQTSFLDDGGSGWSVIAVICAGAMLVHQSWWWRSVIAKHWNLQHANLVWMLLWIIAWCLAILAAIGPLSYRYMFMNG